MPHDSVESPATYRLRWRGAHMRGEKRPQSENRSKAQRRAHDEQEASRCRPCDWVCCRPKDMFDEGDKEREQMGAEDQSPRASVVDAVDGLPVGIRIFDERLGRRPYGIQTQHQSAGEVVQCWHDGDEG